MNKFDIIDEFGVDFKYDYLNDVINHTLEKENVKNAYFDVIFIDDEKMHELNNTYRGIDRTTDVLSFAFEDNNKIDYNIRQLGDIFISIPKMLEQAEAYGHSYKRELAFLTVHGILHLLGYDHTKSKKDEEIMFNRQEVILDEFEETKRN